MHLLRSVITRFILLSIFRRSSVSSYSYLSIASMSHTSCQADLILHTFHQHFFSSLLIYVLRTSAVLFCAAFDTTDHNILLTRLSSWFGIQGSALDWFKSYLSSRSFRVKCNNNFSSCYSCICGVPQGSVLGPLLFFLYTTPLSTLISSLSLNLYADDTQLFFLFYPSVFDSNITQL